MPEMNVTSSVKLITCVLPKGRALKLHNALIEQKDIHTGNFHGGRGVGREVKMQDRGIGEQLEREILEVVVPAERADELFEFMFFELMGFRVTLNNCIRSAGGSRSKGDSHEIKSSGKSYFHMYHFANAYC